RRRRSGPPHQRSAAVAAERADHRRAGRAHHRRRDLPARAAHHRAQRMAALRAAARGDQYRSRRPAGRRFVGARYRARDREEAMTAPPVRGSWQARTVRQVSALTARRLAAAAPVNACTLPLARTLIDQALRTVAPALSGTTVEQIRDGGVAGEWVRGPRAGRTDAVVLYVHGGGFVAGSAAGYRGVASRLSTATRLPVLTLD